MGNPTVRPAKSAADKTDSEPFTVKGIPRGAERVSNADRRLGTLDKTTADRP